jgi:hypothetical protein
VLLSFLVMGGPQQQEEEPMEVEEPWNIRVEDVD